MNYTVQIIMVKLMCESAKTGQHLFLGKIFRSEGLQGIIAELPSLLLLYIWSNLTPLYPQLSL